MAATPEDATDPEPFSPSVFLDLPPTPQPHHDGDGDGDLAESDDLQVLPFIRRMLMEDTDDSILYQEYPDHPALLRAQQPFAQILSVGSTSTATTHAAATDSASGSSATTNSNGFADATWPYDPVELSQLLFSRTRSGTGVGLDGFTGGDANAFSSSGQGRASACGQARAFFNAGDTATIQSSSFGDGVRVTMDMLNQAFLKGMEEANKFLPPTTTTIFGLGATSREHLPGPRDGSMLPRAFPLPNTNSVVDSRGCKNRHSWDDLDDDAETGRRSNKLLAPEPEENGEQVDDVFVKGYELAMEKMHGLSISTNNGSASDGKAKRKSAAQTNEAVDLRTLLTHCAEAVSTGDRRSAAELLRQIRQRSSPRGDTSQRLAHCFAEALEARLAGTGAQVHRSLVARRTSGGVHFLRAYKLYLEVCSFKMIAFKFAHIAICKAITGRKKVHIVDYGDHYGFHWPPLLEAWKDRDGGPPEVRITSIDRPQPGFRPAVRIEETGRRLSDFARRRGVPFRFRSVVASKWEMVCADDLDIEPDEVLIVNGLFHFGKLMDEGVDIDNTSPRDMVLRNIQKMRPDVFILCVENSSYNAPFFVTRFREALYYYSAMFDIMDATTPRDNEERLLVEQDILGCCVLNAIACEGSERMERPETYKQWQVRGHRAGLKQLPLNPNTVNYLSKKVKDGYHKDFVVDVDQQWILQGWKGRILYAMSTWVADDSCPRANVL
ncbi:unnamed protein product [Miscanthus lutarioriparius]|uniref:Scarecrow-like protein 9 n=1 Tax=Miscanthus lutarioriparius TaxID=422564 RepID=A0A811Q7E0_9POAL|nr:unnamed protein product [Miscanthus lutarioriparius]